MATRKRPITKRKPKQIAKGGAIAQRALGPAADEFGQEVKPLGKEAGAVAVKVGRLLISGLHGTVYGIEQVAGWMRDAVAKRLRDIDEDRIVKPNPRIAVPAVQALVYSMGDEFIREMFATLLAADMRLDRKQSVHPAFVEIIKEMTSDEAKIMTVMKYIFGWEYGIGRETIMESKWVEAARMFAQEVPDSERCAVALGNLQRMGLVEVVGPENPLMERLKNPEKVIIPDEGVYGRLGQFVDQKKGLHKSKKAAAPGRPTRVGMYLTPIGQAFVDVCVEPQQIVPIRRVKAP
jgi:hypothetical protein